MNNEYLLNHLRVAHPLTQSPLLRTVSRTMWYKRERKRKQRRELPVVPEKFSHNVGRRWCFPDSLAGVWSMSSCCSSPRCHLLMLLLCHLSQFYSQQYRGRSQILGVGSGIGLPIPLGETLPGVLKVMQVLSMTFRKQQEVFISICVGEPSSSSFISIIFLKDKIRRGKLGKPR